MLAVALVLCLDWLAFTARDPWPGLVAAIPTDRPLTFGVTTSQYELTRFGDRSPDAPGVLVVGNSRLFTAFSPLLAERMLPGARIAMLAAPARDPLAIRSMLGEILAAKPDAVVLLVSEFDTHRPIRIEPIPDNGNASLAALREVFAATPARVTFANRHSIYRVAAADLVDLYRYREITLEAFARRWIEFETPDRLIPSGPGIDDDQSQALVLSPIAYYDATPTPVSPELEAEVARRVTPRPGFEFLTKAVAEIAPGHHVEINMALLRETVRQLSAAGTRVILVEAPAHPAAALLHDTRLRADFLELATSLEREHGARFVRLEEMPAFPASDFVDLVHLGHQGPGVGKLTGSIARGIAHAFQETPFERSH